MRSTVHQTEALLKETLTEVNESTESKINWLSGFSLVMSFVIALLAVVFITLIARSIIRPLFSCVQVADRISKGDLTGNIEVTLQDEVGQLLQAIKHMKDNLFSIVNEVRTASEVVSSASEEISHGNSNLSQRTEEQASSLEETASSMEEMTSTVKQNADNTSQANQLVESARDQAEKGGAVVNNAVSAMTEINASSKKIADIISVIDEIAFQTNLLALNAAVEAARAGEQGRGFAVVASEVRSLAGRSAEAAKEIKVLIEDSVQKVEQGTSLVDESGKTLDDIVDSVKKVADIVSEIAASSREQASGVEQVNKAVMQMDETTQQNAALVEEAAAASESMQDQSKNLLDQISFFNVDSAGADSSETSDITDSANDESTEWSAEDCRRSADRPFTRVSGEPQGERKDPTNQVKQVSSSLKTGPDNEWSEF